ncbi:antitoxin [Citricoccus muralis]|uniref:Ribbon-helix-helix CopG family protein n=1 Tax=Citricoccus muralis TaxID=169134 RepID=A0A3D9LF91_9MICC|nr:antitoxin [Citricoccus muralis]REE04316.1 hypothetical protein C8E99_2150 [Citricoccus muralis]
MTTQMTLRIPDDLAEFIDQLSTAGAGSRATVVTQAVAWYRQRLQGEADARILEERGDYDDFDGLAAHSSIGD